LPSLVAARLCFPYSPPFFSARRAQSPTMWLFGKRKTPAGAEALPAE
jgi:hypothetical protein